VASGSLPNEFDLASEKNQRSTFGAWPEAFKAQYFAFLARKIFLRFSPRLCTAASRLHNFATMFAKMFAALTPYRVAKTNGRARASR